MRCRQVQPDPDDGGGGAVVFVGQQLGEDSGYFFAVDIDVVDPLNQRLSGAEGGDRFSHRYRRETVQLLDIRFDAVNGQRKGHVQPRVLG